MSLKRRSRRSRKARSPRWRSRGSRSCRLDISARRDKFSQYRGENIMAKAYWVATYRSISDPDKLAAYAKLAGPAIQGAGGKFLARGTPAKTYENGLNQRCVVIEFDSVAAAQAAHDSPRYKAALDALGNGADRDIRIMEGA